MELTNEAIDFLRGIFELFDSDNVCPALCFGGYLIFSHVNKVSNFFHIIKAFIVKWQGCFLVA